ncbi:MAG: hypothetical protein HQK65_02460 [Desulfamplus sp.]|nr:hypothetical protein [Desulfamplus sp.]
MLLHRKIVILTASMNAFEKKEIIDRLLFYLPEINTKNIIFCTDIDQNILQTQYPVLTHNLDPSILQQAPIDKKRIFNVDYNKNHVDGWEWFRLTSYCYKNNASDSDNYNTKKIFTNYINILKKNNFNKTYIFGTGPSLSNAINGDWSDGYRIVCNTIVRDSKLWNHINPHFIVAGDAIYHFGHTPFANKFREDLKKRMYESDTYFLYPSTFDHLVKRTLPEFEDRLIPVVIGSHKNIWVNLTRDFSLPAIGNVLNLLLLPLACTLSKKIHLWGFDGKAPKDKLFWSNSCKHSYPELLQGLKLAHPAFFSHFVPENDPYSYVNSVLGEQFENNLKQAESQGFEFKMLHFSWTPTLNQRFKENSDIS